MPQKDTDDPEIPIGAEFGAKVRAARLARGWKRQSDLGKRCRPRISQSTVSMIENGHGSSSAVLSVCRVLGLEPPAIVLSDEQRRWMEVGKVLAARAPGMFSSTLDSNGEDRCRASRSRAGKSAAGLHSRARSHALSAPLTGSLTDRTANAVGMDSSADGEGEPTPSVDSMLARWAAVGISLAGKRPDVFAAMIVAGESTVAALSTETEPTRH